MKGESVAECRRGWCDSASRCAMVLGTCAVLVSLVALTLILVKQEPRKSEEVPPPSSWIQPPQQTRAQLVLNGSSEIANRTLTWLTSDHVEKVIFGQEFDYDNVSDSLKIKSGGMYHISAQMAAKCALASTEEGTVALIIHHKTAHTSTPILTLNVHLYRCLNERLLASMGVLFPLKENDSLHVTLRASINPNSDSTKFLSWQLEKPDTVFSVSKMSGNSK